MQNRTLKYSNLCFLASTARDSRSPVLSPRATSTRVCSRTKISSPWKVSETLWPTVDMISIKKTDLDSIVRAARLEHVSRNIRDGVTQLLREKNSILLETWQYKHQISRPDLIYIFCSNQNVRGLRTLNTSTTHTETTRQCPAWGTAPRPAGGEIVTINPNLIPCPQTDKVVWEHQLPGQSFLLSGHWKLSLVWH